jgi:hypothetical protein
VKKGVGKKAVPKTTKGKEGRGKKKEIQIFNDDCPICLEPINAKDTKKRFITNCGHQYHTECISGLTKMSCPMCNAYLVKIPKTLHNTIDKNIKARRQEEANQFNQEIQTAVQYIRGLGSIDQMEALIANPILRQYFPNFPLAFPVPVPAPVPRALPIILS